MQTKEIEILLESVPMPAVAVGKDQAILSLNSGAKVLFGDKSVGRHYIAALRKPNLLRAVETVAQTGESVQALYSVLNAGQETTYNVHVAAAGDMQVLSFQDISAAEEAGQMRRDFVANVSHELRTPLTALLGFIETLRGNAKDDPVAQERFLNIMEREAFRMTRIVEDLLSLSRVEAAERVRPQEQVSLSELVRATIADMEPVIRASDCKIDLVDDSNGQLVMGDPPQLRQVVGNLIENAVKYGANGSTVNVKVSIWENEARLRSRAISLTVKDQGEGIESHHIPRLTERFYRVDTHRSRSVGGTGLGLAIVKHIINRHRGRLLIESEVGKGTEITVFLPLPGS